MAGSGRAPLIIRHGDRGGCAGKLRPVVFRKMRSAVAGTVVGVVATGGVARAGDTDTEHLFGFTEGADIGKAGEREVESETIARAGKSSGSYATVLQNYEAKFVPVQSADRRKSRPRLFRHIGRSRPRGPAAGLIAGFSFEARYALVDRHNAPFGLTLIAESHWGRVDDISGEPARVYSGMLTVAMDKELIPGRLFGAFNILYDTDATHLRVPDIWQHQSKIGLAAALAVRVQPTLFLGGELRYQRSYDGLGLDAFTGQALFAGPTIYLQISKHLAMSGAWNWQLSGRTATGGGSLDLTHFERQQAKLRFNYNF